MKEFNSIEDLFDFLVEGYNSYGFEGLLSFRNNICLYGGIGGGINTLIMNTRYHMLFSIYPTGTTFIVSMYDTTHTYKLMGDQTLGIKLPLDYLEEVVEYLSNGE